VTASDLRRTLAGRANRLAAQAEALRDAAGRDAGTDAGERLAGAAWASQQRAETLRDAASRAGQLTHSRGEAASP